LSILAKEIEIIRNLRNKYITQFYDICLVEVQIAMIMEYAENGSLSGLLNNRHFNMNWEFRKKITKEIIHGIIYLRTNSVIHRDLKSLNTLMAKYNEAKVCDLVYPK